MTALTTSTQEIDTHCWCCGRTLPDSELFRLGSHPEAAVCGRCARYLARRARQRRDQQAPTRGAHARSLIDRGRRVVIARGWHRQPRIGRFLRWLGDRLP